MVKSLVVGEELLNSCKDLLVKAGADWTLEVKVERKLLRVGDVPISSDHQHSSLLTLS